MNTIEFVSTLCTEISSRSPYFAVCLYKGGKLFAVMFDPMTARCRSRVIVNAPDEVEWERALLGMEAELNVPPPCHSSRKPVIWKCATCGSHRVRYDAFAAFNVDTQQFELAEMYQDSFCERCDCSTRIIEVPLVVNETLYNRCIENREPDWSSFQGFCAQPCARVPRAGGAPGETSTQVVDEVDVEFWCVYGIPNDGKDWEALTEVTTRKIAASIARRFDGKRVGAEVIEIKDFDAWDEFADQNQLVLVERFGSVADAFKAAYDGGFTMGGGAGPLVQIHFPT